jgi:hypothetical protein
VLQPELVEAPLIRVHGKGSAPRPSVDSRMHISKSQPLLSQPLCKFGVRGSQFTFGGWHAAISGFSLLHSVDREGANCVNR